MEQAEKSVYSQITIIAFFIDLLYWHDLFLELDKRIILNFVPENWLIECSTKFLNVYQIFVLRVVVAKYSWVEQSMLFIA